VYKIAQTTSAGGDRPAAITARSQGNNTVTESVVLPPLIGGVHDAPVKEAGPIYPVLVPSVVDWCNQHQLPALVIFGLVYLAGLR
jgi:hypothetical protein